MINQARLVLAALLLALVVMVDFTSKLMSVLADGVLVAMVVIVMWPLVKSEK
ncbi:DUF3927 family protein [Lelliottia sp. SL45]|uniref:DUF3927 family protein n=1 Tax=Lelliottia sp. SL45 TaxID=2994665 RepID=UPI00227546B9|nr:DUF3927 family protein [Lelliottia sp. SL45]MCY1698642.1 DUF3927 family protein [Lelliottia sp. SL45]